MSNFSEIKAPSRNAEQYGGRHRVISWAGPQRVRELVDSGAPALVSIGSFASARDGVGTRRDADDSEYQTGLLEESPIGLYDRDHATAAGAPTGFVRAFHVDVLDPMPTNWHKLHADEKPSCEAQKLDVRALFRHLSAGEQRARIAVLEELVKITGRLCPNFCFEAWGELLRLDIIPRWQEPFAGVYICHPEFVMRFMFSMTESNVTRTDTGRQVVTLRSCLPLCILS